MSCVTIASSLLLLPFASCVFWSLSCFILHHDDGMHEDYDVVVGSMKLRSYHLIYLFACIIKSSTPLICNTMTSTTKRPSLASARSLHANADQDGNESNDVMLRSECHCGQVTLDISLPKDDISNEHLKVWSCHCPSCRKYHTAAHVSYLQLPKDRISISNQKMIGKYISSCQSLEETSKVVERWFCRDCSSKLLSVVSSDTNANDEMRRKQEQSNYCLVNLGPINPDTIPQSYSHLWKEQLKQIENNLHSSEEESSTCRWAGVLPSNTDLISYSARRRIRLSNAKIWSGGCECGACRYEISLTRLTQLQHCYCNLCRKLSGSPYSTWLPIDKERFQWEQPNSVTLVRTTPVVQRHICNRCRGVMTIVYDEQPNLIWPCAGGLDDVTLPESSDEMGKLLSRVCHICCRHLPPWMDLPEDGMEKLPDAC